MRRGSWGFLPAAFAGLALRCDPHRSAGVEALAERLHDPVAGARGGRVACPHAADLVGHALELDQRHVAERLDRVPLALAALLDGLVVALGRIAEAVAQRVNRALQVPNRVALKKVVQF